MSYKKGLKPDVAQWVEAEVAAGTDEVRHFARAYLDRAARTQNPNV